MTQLTIYPIHEIPEDAAPEESMLSWIEEIYRDYHNEENEKQIQRRKSILIKLYNIKISIQNLSDDEKASKICESDDLKFEYEKSLDESMSIGYLHDDYETRYLTIYELKHVCQEFYNDSWLDINSFYEVLIDLMENHT